MLCAAVSRKIAPERGVKSTKVLLKNSLPVSLRRILQEDRPRKGGVVSTRVLVKRQFLQVGSALKRVDVARLMVGLTKWGSSGDFSLIL